MICYVNLLLKNYRRFYLFIDLIIILKNKIYGNYILILVLRDVIVLNKDIVKNEVLEEFNVVVDMENSFWKWVYNKIKGSYVFFDWILFDGKYDEDDLCKI